LRATAANTRSIAAFSIAFSTSRDLSARDGAADLVARNVRRATAASQRYRVHGPAEAARIFLQVGELRLELQLDRILERLQPPPHTLKRRHHAP
jgi:hypothetical protein